MKTYLVDFENVKSKGLSGIDRLSEDDHVIIFYSENSDTISFEMHCMVMQAKANVNYMKVRVGGKNALDFQLSTLLGYLVAQETNTHIFIISNDRGFDKLHDFWENTFADAPACKVFRTPNIYSAINYARYNTVPEPVHESEDENEYEESETAPETTIDESAAESNPEPNNQEEVQEEDTADSKVIDIEVGDENSEPQEEEKPSENEKLQIDREIIRRLIEEGAARAKAEEEAKRKKREEENAKLREEEAKRNQGINGRIRRELLNATESRVKDLEPYFQEYLMTSEAQDKHALLKRFLPDTDDDTVELVRDLILRSQNKSDLHNMLQQHYDNEKSAFIFNHIKKNYYFFKRILIEDEKYPVPIPDLEEIERKKALGESQPEAVEASAEIDHEPYVIKMPDREQYRHGTSEYVERADAIVRRQLHEKLADICTPTEFENVITVLNVSATRRKFYLNMIQRFNQNRGRELYGKIKDIPLPFNDKERNIMEKQRRKKPKGEAGVYEIIKNLLGDIVEEEDIQYIFELVKESETPQKLYLGIIKRYGRKRGMPIYNLVKEEFIVLKRGLAGKPRK